MGQFLVVSCSSTHPLAIGNSERKRIIIKNIEEQVFNFDMKENRTVIPNRLWTIFK